MATVKGASDNRKQVVKNYGSAPNAIYGLGIIGAAVYYVIHATSFWVGVLGLIKAVFWPAFLVFKVFDLLKM